MTLRNQIILGDALETARQIPDNYINTIITSPPYYGLRDYNVDGQLGLERSPQEYIEKLVLLFHELRRALRNDGTCWLNLGDSHANMNRTTTTDQTVAKNSKRRRSNGDPYGELKEGKRIALSGNTLGIKEKDLIGIPWRVAFALQAEGWYLRQDIVWQKVNPMPESVKDRPTMSHEYIFLLTKKAHYWYDAEAIKEPAKETSLAREKRGVSDHHKNIDGAPGQPPHSMNQPRPNVNKQNGVGKRTYEDFNERYEPVQLVNKRSVWEVATTGFSGAHFAVFPEALIEPMILAGCPKQCCAACGAPYERLLESTFELNSGRPQARRAMEIARERGLTEDHIRAIRACGITDTGKARITQSGTGKNVEQVQQLADEAKQLLGGYYREFLTVEKVDKGLVSTCDCDTSTRPGLVYDPFMGAGTTAKVAQRLGRDFLGSELNPEYIALANERLYAPPAPKEKRDDAPKTLKMFE